MAVSIDKVEYVTACSTSCEEVWLRNLLSNLFDLELDATCIYCEAYRDQISIYHGYGAERSSEALVCCDE